MAVPKKGRSYTRQAKRRSHLALKRKSYQVNADCPDCADGILPHRACDRGFDCETYKATHKN